MFALKQLGDEQLGGYRFVVGMGACATCNGFWLVARALFRETSPVSAKHILAAGGLGLMLIVGQGMGLLQSMAQVELVMLQQSRVALYEVVNLISSCMLVLAAWEGCRGLRKAQGQQLWQRLLFLASYCSAVLLCTILVKFSDSSDAATELSKVLSTVCAIQIIIVTQVLICWRFHQKPRYAKHIATGSLNIPLATTEVIFNEQTKITGNEEDTFLAKQIQQVLEQQNMYLQTSLKVADLARHMSVSEYRISRIFRYNFQARNFNQFINEMRIKHAKSLLEDPKNAQWPILVVGLESGFASVGPFTRAFKSICDMTPNQYRLFHQSTTEDCSSQINRTLV
ncbi:MAG: helix-turn-helix transcriptional regulator [Paraglaciecola sp.]|nr:helix-turn-helix transcriptional regulator [Paraglaciecola sp.]